MLVAPTGSGKTTQAPQLLYADGVVDPGKRIVVLQPRRVAARSVALRVAAEMGVAPGGLVGYQVRFDQRIGADTRIAYVTEGILLRWLQSDPLLSDVGALFFDEFHERNLLSDAALALCKHLQRAQRPDLKLIVMSATLEAEPVARYLGCPILESQGRAFPVTMRYQEWGDDTAVWERAAERVGAILDSSEPGDVLVFMPGLYEIERTIELLRQTRRAGGALATLAFYGEMSARDQDRVFAPTDVRRVIVATNVAETSITIPGIRHVVDSGLARVARFDPARGVNTLHVEPISQASAEQRAGRAGRVAPGVCHRLWTEAQHATRPLKNMPEVQRSELSAVLLLLHAMGVTDIAHFDFLDKPDPARVAVAETLLESLGAIAQGVITETGRRMLRIPAHPRYARMLLEAEAHGCVREAALFAALVGGRDLLARINPLDERDRVLKRNRQTLLKRSQTLSDFTLLARSFEHAAACNFDGKQCFLYGVNAGAAREVAQSFEQLLSICEEARLDATQPCDPARLDEAIARCHLVGFVDHLAVRAGAGSSEYELAGGRRAELADESVVRSALLLVTSDIREIGTRDGGSFTLLNVVSQVQAAWVRALQPPGLHETVDHVYDRLSKRVVAGRVLRYHDLLIGGERLEQVEPSAAARVLAEEFADRLDRHPQWSQLKPRVAAMTRPQLVDALTRAFDGATSAADVMKCDVLAALVDAPPSS